MTDNVEQKSISAPGEVEYPTDWDTGKHCCSGSNVPTQGETADETDCRKEKSHMSSLQNFFLSQISHLWHKLMFLSAGFFHRCTLTVGGYLIQASSLLISGNVSSLLIPEISPIKYTNL